MRNQCPVCPHREEQPAQSETVYYQNTGADNWFREQMCMPANQYQSGDFEEYGHNNLYSYENIYSGYSSKYPFYDSVNYMYMDPRENITSPWDNNRRFENNLTNEIYLPERPFG
jgi:hypothetical protein